MDCSLPGSSVHGILQVRIVERVFTPLSRTQGSNLGGSPALQVDSLPSEPPQKPNHFKVGHNPRLKAKEKGAGEGEMVGWHHRFNGHKSEQAPGDGEGQGSLASCSPWGRRVRHNSATEQQQFKLTWVLLRRRNLETKKETPRMCAQKATGKRQPSSSWGEMAQEKPNLPTSWYWTSSVQNSEKINVCCLSHPGSTLLWQP